MSRAKPKRPSKQAATQPSDPAHQQQFVQLLKQLHDAVNSGSLIVAMQAMPRIAKLHEEFPKNVNVLVLMGRGYMAIRNTPESLTYYKKALALMPTEPDINFQYGVALENAGHLDHALDRYERVLQQRPNHFYAMRNRVTTLNSLGRTNDAFEAYQQLVEKYAGTDLDPDQLNALAITGATFAPDRTDAKESLETLESRIEEAGDRELIRAGSIQLARLHKHFKQYDEAFDWYVKGKDVEKDEWDCDEYSRRIDRLIDCWSNNSIPFSQARNIDGSRLIFIIGMPRSGTSLIEQMLGQLRTIEPGGEMTVIDSEIPRSERVSLRHATRLPLDPVLYSQAVIDAMSKNAMKGYNKVSKRLVVTDKQPYNYALAPMIAHMLPGARFIHCTRDPISTCFSNYSTAFTQLHMHTHDLYWLGRYYADYERVMEAWKKLPEVEMIDLPYEEVVSEPEPLLRSVLDFLGQEWDDGILRFHESERTVLTASRDQVRQELYTSAIAKYKPFEHRLDDLRRGLEEGRARPHGA
jgi:tetratricopeptide (TPR) repeat protein